MRCWGLCFMHASFSLALNFHQKNNFLQFEQHSVIKRRLLFQRMGAQGEHCESVDDVTSLRKALSQASSSLTDIYSQTDITKERTVVEDHELEIVQENFWGNSAKAQKVMSSLEQHKGRLSRLERLETSLADCAVALEIAEHERAHPGISKNGTTELVLEAVRTLTALLKEVEEWKLEALLSGPHDQRAARITITAGAGGTDAQDWAHMLMRMYERWADRKGLAVMSVEVSRGDEAGIRSAELHVHGKHAYGMLAGEKVVENYQNSNALSECLILF
jgi:peptide chain release factor 2